MSKTPLLTVLAVLAFMPALFFIPSSSAKAESFDLWRSQFKQRAAEQGISQATLASAFYGVVPSDRIIELDGKQPERKKTGFKKYLHNVVSQTRIDNGRDQYALYQDILKKTEQVYGVPAEIIVSLWGIETSYGQNTGGFDLIQALSTLAWEGRRREFFEKELFTALSILQGGHINRQDFKGSWAGAMGQNQFMPSSWENFAVDADGDGHRDIWNTKADIFASSSNYLKKNGWDSRYPWGWAVSVPLSIESFADSKIKKPVAEWINMGVRVHQNQRYANREALARLVIPDGGEGRAYLVTTNFDTILSWNRSDYFALSVGILSDFIAQSPVSSSSHFNQ